MKRITITLSILIIIFLLPLSGFPDQSSRHALVIGNAAYQSAPLKNPANDAYDMSRTLRALGFDVIHKENVGQKDMEKAIRDFGRRLRKGGVGLFYYAGHGMQVNGRNYLIPIDAEIYEEKDIKYEAVDAGRILDEMHTAGNNLNIVFLDACRSNPFVRSFRTSERGLARMAGPTGTLIAYSTAPGMVAADGEDKNAVYTKYLLKHITTPGLTVEQILKKVRVDVMRETGNKQVPWEASSLTGDFYFALKRAVVIKPLPKHREIGRDDNFIAYANGIVRDTNTGLEWMVGPDRDMSWNEAQSWVESLTDEDDWRMPKIVELSTLYQKGKGSRNMTPLLNMRGWWVWSGEGRSRSSAWHFFFYNGRQCRVNCDYSVDDRAFAVRSRK